MYSRFVFQINQSIHPIKLGLFVLLIFRINTINVYAQTLTGTLANGSSTTSSSTYSTVTGASVSLDVTGVNNVLVLASFELSMTSVGADIREASLRIADNADPANINSGIFRRSLSNAKSTDYGIGSIVYIFDVSSYSGNRNFILQHAFSNPARTLTTNATIVAIVLLSDAENLKNSVKRVSTPVTLSDSWSVVTGSETDVITTTVTGGFYVAASIESLTTSFTTESTARWKLQYRKGAAGTWYDLSQPIDRSMSNTNDRGLISLAGCLSDVNTAGDYYFRIAHIRTSATSTIETAAANIVAVSLGVGSGNFPVFSQTLSSAETTSSSLTGAIVIPVTPLENTDLFMHSQFNMTASGETNSSTYDLFVDNSIFNGMDYRRYISSSSDLGSGTSIGLAQNLISDTEYNVSLRHSSSSGNTLTSYNISLNGFATTLNSGPLPIRLLSFEAEQDVYDVTLSWVTISESNNDYFTIERSIDNSAWREIITCKGAGNSNYPVRYSVKDIYPGSGLNYYRLKQTDFDGAYSYSETISVNFKSKPSDIEIFPNPANNQITLLEDLAIEDFRIFNSIGQDMTSYVRIIHNSGVKNVLDISNLSQGVYIMKSRSYSRIMIKE